MKDLTEAEPNSLIPEFLSGGGEMGERIRNFNWSETDLGPVNQWPQSLKTCVRIMLTSRQPIWIGWGPKLIKMYNDPYIEIVGGKHPTALGKPASEVWKDIWEDIEPMLKAVMEKDQGTYVESQLLIMERNGYPEETYYTFSYTPIPGDNGKTAGMFCANTDDTERIIQERQLKTLSRLAKGLIDSKTTDQIFQTTIEVLKHNPYDFPFTLIRSLSGDKGTLAASTELGESSAIVPKELDLQSGSPAAEIIKRAFHSNQPQIINEITNKIGKMPRGAWKIPPHQAIVIPISLTANTNPIAVMIVGLNPYRAVNDEYKSFFSLVADQITTSIIEARSQEEERKRIEALAELDKVKTTFFSNISHEFRTPLTLLLGPIEEVIDRNKINEDDKSALSLALRNGMRMQKLVNTLLDFSRAEAGRLTGRFRKVDIVDLTKELASLFQPVMENAGVRLIVNLNPVRSDVYVDTEMWEKIVVNLLSNAFKYTEKGTITLSIKNTAHSFKLEVADTGIGIAKSQQHKIFDRFYRVESSDGRSQEGTGIGLAMVRELVKVHKGNITLESEEGKGSTFTVEIPTGRQHLSSDHVTENATAPFESNSAKAFIEEANRWHPTVTETKKNISSAAKKQYNVLLADDNADMREYVLRVLSDNFNVEIAHDGEEAFQKIQKKKPDLILSDIMMPKLNGYELLQKLKDHPDTRDIPVIFLSARAGEEAKIEGIKSGADDYLVKPFSAKELVVRVAANIKISQSRVTAQQNLKSILLQAPVAFAQLVGKDLRVEIVNDKALEIWGRSYDQVINKSVFEALPEIVTQGFDKILTGVYETGEPFIGNEVPVELMRFGKAETVYVNFTYQALRNENNDITSILGVGVDVSDLVKARKKSEESEEQLKIMANAMPQLVWEANNAGDVVYFNNRIAEFSGIRKLPNGHWEWSGLIHPDDQELSLKKWQLALNSGGIFELEHRIQLRNGSYRWHLSRALSQKDSSGNSIRWFGTTTDIHDAKEQSELLDKEVKKRTKELEEVNTALKQSNEDLLQFAHVASHDLKEPVRKIKTFTGRIMHESNDLAEKDSVFLGKIMLAADRMTSMIEGVLNYSTLNASQQPIETVSLSEVLDNVAADLELLIQQKGATIVKKGDFPEMEGATVLMHQLFYNLLNNSLKFSRKDVSPLIEITSTIFEKNNKDFVKILVKDNGIGFDNSSAKTIFDTFTRLNSKDLYEGTGIGLALCKKIVARHQGQIEATGKRNEGAVISMTLPLLLQNQHI